MLRRVLALLPAIAIAIALAVQADTPPPAAGPAKDIEASTDRIVREQDRLAREYKQFEELLLRLAQRLERSTNPDEKKKAEALRNAINLANDQRVEQRFSKLMGTLLGKEGGSRVLTTDELEKAAGQNEELVKILRSMLELLLTDAELLRKREEMAKLQELIKQIDNLIRTEKVIQATTDGNRVDSKSIGKEQNKATKQTESIARAMGGEPKSGQPKAGDPKAGDPKSGTPKAGDPKSGDPKSGDPKSGNPKSGDPKSGDPKSGDPKSGDPKSGNPQNPPQQPPQPNLPGKEQVQKAIEGQKQAEKNLDKDKRDDASKNLDDVITKLEEARKELEKRLKQLREEEMLQTLAKLQERCERMLAIQLEVYDGTKRVFAVVQNYPDKKPQRAEEQRSQQLSTREGELVKEANKTLQLLEAEGSAAAFAMAMEGVRDDAVSIERRLDKYDSGETTQRMEEDVIAALKDMIEALKKAQQDIKDKQNKPPPPNNNPPPPNKLLDMLAELKLIRTMQMQVNNRTKHYSTQYQGEQADAVLLQDEISNLSKRQVKIEEKLKDIATGKNQ